MSNENKASSRLYSNQPIKRLVVNQVEACFSRLVLTSDPEKGKKKTRVKMVNQAQQQNMSCDIKVLSQSYFHLLSINLKVPNLFMYILPNIHNIILFQTSKGTLETLQFKLNCFFFNDKHIYRIEIKLENITAT